MAPKEWRKAREIEADLLAAAERANDSLCQEAAATIHSLAYAVRAVAKGERLIKRAVAIADCRQKTHTRERLTTPPAIWAGGWTPPETGVGDDFMIQLSVSVDGWMP